MRLRCTSLIACSVERLRAELERPVLLQHLAAPMLAFVPQDPPEFPAVWTPGDYRARLLVGGRIPIGVHTLSPQPLPPDSSPLVWHDAGHSGLIRVWDHQVTIVEVHGMTRYTDLVEVHAGLLTGVAWLFAKAFYTHRQRRLNRLAAAGFDYHRAR